MRLAFPPSITVRAQQIIQHTGSSAHSPRPSSAAGPRGGASYTRERASRSFHNRTRQPAARRRSEARGQHRRSAAIPLDLSAVGSLNSSNPRVWENQSAAEPDFHPAEATLPDPLARCSVLSYFKSGALRIEQVRVETEG